MQHKMKKHFGCFVLCILWSFSIFGQKITNVEMLDALSGQKYSLEKNRSSTAQVFIFYSLKCPYSKLYDGRVMDMVEKFGKIKVTFALVNPYGGQEGETSDQMASLAFAKNNKLPFLIDENQVFTKMTGVRKIPEVVIITSGPTGYNIAYKGAIDNNAQSMESATVHYLNAALTDILKRDQPSPAVTRAVGCNIRISP
jgi:hypothetical protein